MTEKPSFTPGPWEVDHDGKSAKIMATTPRGLKKSIAIVGGYGGESRAGNAALMASAPELYAALQAVDELWSVDCGGLTLDYDFEVEFGSPVGLAWKKVRAALAKAQEPHQ